MDSLLRQAFYSHEVAAAGIEALYAIGYRFLSADDATRATPVFRLMLQLACKDERAWFGLARCHELLDQDDVAAELYASACLVCPGSKALANAHEQLVRRMGRHFA